MLLLLVWFRQISDDCNCGIDKKMSEFVCLCVRHGDRMLHVAAGGSPVKALVLKSEPLITRTFTICTRC